MSMPMIHLRRADDKRKGGHYATSACGLANAWTYDAPGLCLECQIALGLEKPEAREELAARCNSYVKDLLADGLVEKPDAYGRMRITRKGMRKLF